MERSRHDSEPRSWTARVLAPLALIAAVAAIVLVVSGSPVDDDGNDSEQSKDSTKTSTTCSEPEAADSVEAGYYVVTAEDTAGMSGIAAKTCVPLERLENLNPNLDPQTLQVDNCVDLIRDGCKALAG